MVSTRDKFINGNLSFSIMEPDKPYEVTRYEEQKPLAAGTYNKILEAAGLSPNLESHMRALNDALADEVLPPSVKRLSIILSPDYDSPVPFVETEFRKENQIRLDIFPEQETGQLRVGDGTTLLAIARLDAVKKFYADLFPKKLVQLYWRPTIRIGDQVKKQPVEANLEELTTHNLQSLPQHRYSVRVADVADSVMTIGPDTDNRLPEPAMKIFYFALNAAPRELERAIELLAPLFSHNPYSHK